MIFPYTSSISIEQDSMYCTGIGQCSPVYRTVLIRVQISTVQGIWQYCAGFRTVLCREQGSTGQEIGQYCAGYRTVMGIGQNCAGYRQYWQGIRKYCAGGCNGFHFFFQNSWEFPPPKFVLLLPFQPSFLVILKLFFLRIFFKIFTIVQDEQVLTKILATNL